MRGAQDGERPPTTYVHTHTHTRAQGRRAAGPDPSTGTLPILRGHANSPLSPRMQNQPGQHGQSVAKPASSSSAGCLLPSLSSQKPLLTGRNQAEKTPAYTQSTRASGPSQAPGRRTVWAHAPPHWHRPPAGTRSLHLSNEILLRKSSGKTQRSARRSPKGIGTGHEAPGRGHTNRTEIP